MTDTEIGPIVNWFNRNYNFNLSKQASDEEIKVCTIKLIQMRLNQLQPEKQIEVNGEYDKPTYLGVQRHLCIKYYKENDSDLIYYILRIILTINGYYCAFNGCFDNELKRQLQKYKVDYVRKSNHNISYGFYIDHRVWYSLFKSNEEIMEVNKNE